MFGLGEVRRLLYLLDITKLYSNYNINKDLKLSLSYSLIMITLLENMNHRII